MKKFFLVIFISIICTTSLFSHTIHYFSTSEDMSPKEAFEYTGFKKYSRENSNFGLNNKTYWILVSLENNSGLSQKYHMVFLFPLLEKVSMYGKTKEGVVEIKKAGSLIPSSNPDITEPNLTFAQTVDGNKSHEVLFKINSKTPLHLNMNIYSNEEFRQFTHEKVAITAFYVGVISIILLYNLILYSFIRVNAYLAYVAFHFSYMTFILGTRGETYLWFWSDKPQIALGLTLFLVPFTITLLNLFALLFLEVKKHSIRLAKFIYWVLGLGCFTSFLVLVLPMETALALGNLFSITGTLSALFVALMIFLLKRTNNSIYFMVAWTIFLLSIIIEHGKNYGVIEISFFTEYSLIIGNISETFLISIALANHFRTLRKSNLTLKEVATKDSLTGLHNRRYFTGFMKGFLARNMPNKVFTLAMIDIDHFKKINDIYGHSVGDFVLKTFALLVRKNISNQELFVRYGGEEFIAVIRGNQKEAIEILENIRIAIKKSEINLPNIKQPINFTISIGAQVFTTRNLPLETIVNKADAALYKAKNSGRDKVVFS